jgi:hypothetical protein
MQQYGIYTRMNDAEVWCLEYVTNKAAAQVAEEINTQYGVSTLIVGPLITFPKFVES